MSDPASVVLLWGNDRGAIGEAMTELRRQILGADGAKGGGMAAFNHERFAAPYIGSFAPVLRACGQMPVMGERRLVEVSDPEDVSKHAGKADASERKSTADPIIALVEYISAPNPTTVLAITTSGLKSTSRLVKAVAGSDQAAARRLDVPDERDAARNIQEEARHQGVRLDPEAASALVRAVGASRTELMLAFERARDHAGGDTVGVADVDAVVVDEREVDVFGLTDAVGQRDARRALVLLAQAFGRGEQDVGAAQRLFSLLVRHVRLLFVAKQAGRDATAALGLPPFIARKYTDQAARTDLPQLRAAYSGLARIDRDLKGESNLGSRSPYLLLQRWVLDACGMLEDAEPRG